jgi:hypothetical protein
MQTMDTHTEKSEHRRNTRAGWVEGFCYMTLLGEHDCWDLVDSELLTPKLLLLPYSSYSLASGVMLLSRPVQTLIGAWACDRALRPFGDLEESLPTPPQILGIQLKAGYSQTRTTKTRTLWRIWTPLRSCTWHLALVNLGALPPDEAVIERPLLHD